MNAAVTLINILSLHLTYVNGWFKLIEAATLPISYIFMTDVLGLRPVLIFSDMVEPYTSFLLFIGHAISLTLSKNSILNCLAMVLSGDFAGPRLQAGIRRSLSFLLPAASFNKLLTLYQAYYKLVGRLRR